MTNPIGQAVAAGAVGISIVVTMIVWMMPIGFPAFLSSMAIAWLFTAYVVGGLGLERDDQRSRFSRIIGGALMICFGIGASITARSAMGSDAVLALVDLALSMAAFGFSLIITVSKANRRLRRLALGITAASAAAAIVLAGILVGQ